MKTLSTRLSLTALSLALCFSCAAPVVQPGQIKAAIDTNKVAALQEKINQDETLLDALSADPKAFLTKEGINVPADQQVKVLEVGSKLYLVLDDRSLKLLHPELNKAAVPENETAKKLAAIRAKAAADPAFKAELLKNTAQALSKEGIPEEVASQFEVVDYQPNVNLLMIASEGAEISRATLSRGDWDLSRLKFSFEGKTFVLPLAFRSAMKTILDNEARNFMFTKPFNQSENERYQKIQTKLVVTIDVGCAFSATLTSVDFCVPALRSGLKGGDFADGLSNGITNFLTDPLSYYGGPTDKNLQAMYDFNKKYTDLETLYKKLKELEANESSSPQMTGSMILSQLEQIKNTCLSLDQLKGSIKPTNDEEEFAKKLQKVADHLKEAEEKITTRKKK